MKYYVVTIEQIYDKDGNLSEYSSKPEKKNDLESALTYFYTRCAEIVNSLGTEPNDHTFADIRILNSEGGEEKRDKIGAYIDAEALAKAEAEKAKEASEE